MRNYLYIKNVQDEVKTRWKCTLYYTGKCKGFCITTADGKLFLTQRHSHPPNLEKNSCFPILREILMDLLYDAEKVK